MIEAIELDMKVHIYRNSDRFVVEFGKNKVVFLTVLLTLPPPSFPHFPHSSPPPKKS